MGRRKLKSREAKSLYIRFRVTAEQRARIRRLAEQAKEAGESASEAAWIREKLLSQ